MEGEGGCGSNSIGGGEERGDELAGMAIFKRSRRDRSERVWMIGPGDVGRTISSRGGEESGEVVGISARSGVRMALGVDIWIAFPVVRVGEEGRLRSS